MKKRLVFFGIFFFLCSCFAFAQTKQISGTVTSSDDGMGIPGVSVVVKGTTIGIQTDIDGKYTLSIPSDATIIVFSFVGFKTEEIAITGEIINVVMNSEAKELEEVVVVAYGTAKKLSLTGAVTSVNSVALEKRPVSSVTGALEGLTSGVQVNNSYGEPGSSPTIRIRGFTSINNSNSPLYVMDGVPYSGSITDINPNDIESISVLKDAASSALYGNRASNGVVLITTKKGKNDKASFTVSTNQGLYFRGIKEYEKLDEKEFMEAMWKGYRNKLTNPATGTPMTVELANEQASNTLVATWLKYNIFNKADNALFQSDGKMVSDAKVLKGYNDLKWNKYIERVGYRQEYNISGDANTSKNSYYFSAGYLDEKGYLKASDFKRLTGRANISITPRKWLKVGSNISGSHQESNNTNGDGGSAIANPFNFARNMAPIYPVYLHDMTTGELLLDSDGNKQYDRGGLYSRPQYLDRHIVWETELNMDRTYRNTMQSGLFVDVNFLKDFKFSVKGDINLRNSENKTYNTAIIGDGAGNNGRTKRETYRYKIFTFQQQLSWNKAFDKHNVDAFVGHENYSWNRNYLYGYKTTENFPDLPELSNFTMISSLDGYEDNYKTESYLSRVRYNYDEKYFFEVSFRRDGSSRFHPDNRWGNFWSIGGSWNIIKEEFMAGLKSILNSMKLRASYGEVGNDQLNSYYPYMALYALEQNGNVGALYKSQNEWNALKWETSSAFGIGLEGRIYDRANFSFEYFDKRSQNLLFDVNLPLSAGSTSTSSAEATVAKNIGTISNSGIEIAVDVDVIKKSDFKWNIGFNATTLKNKIVRLPKENRKEGIIDGTKRYLEGHGIYDFWLPQFVGVDQMTGQALYEINYDKFYITTPEDGKSPIPAQYLVQIGDKYYTNFVSNSKKDWSGSAIPDVYGSISNSLSYKSFDLSVLLTYSLGGKNMDYNYQSLMQVTSSPHALHKDLLKSWDGIPEGMTVDSKNRIDKNGIPAINYDLSADYSNFTSDRFLQDASYLIIKNITLNYKLPKNLLSRIDVSSVSVNVSVENLATFTKLQGMNPQRSFNGINDAAFVTARIFSMGLNVKF